MRLVFQSEQYFQFNMADLHVNLGTKGVEFPPLPSFCLPVSPRLWNTSSDWIMLHRTREKKKFASYCCAWKRKTLPRGVAQWPDRKWGPLVIIRWLLRALSLIEPHSTSLDLIGQVVKSHRWMIHHRRVTYHFHQGVQGLRVEWQTLNL